MRVLSFKKNNENRATAEIFIDRDEFEKNLNIVWGRQKRWFNVKGFRKGKVPRAVIENEYGKDVFHASALRLLYRDMIDLLAKETGEDIYFLKEEIYLPICEDFKPSEVTDYEGGVMTKFDLNLYPKLEINTNFTIELDPKKVATQEEIDHHVEVIKKQAGWKSMNAETPVELHDKVRLNILRLESVDDDPTDPLKKPIEVSHLNGLKYCLGGDGINPDMPKLNDTLIGHSMKEGAIELSGIDFPADLPNKRFAGRKVKALLELVAVKRRLTVKELAEKMNLASEEDLYKDIERKINGYYENAYEGQKDPKIVEKLIEQVPDDVLPKDILDAYTVAIRHQLSQNPGYSRYSENEMNSLSAGIAVSNLKTEIALFSVGKSKNIEITSEMKESMRNQLSKNMSKADIEQIPDTEIEKLQMAAQALEIIKSSVKFVDRVSKDVKSDESSEGSTVDSLDKSEDVQQIDKPSNVESNVSEDSVGEAINEPQKDVAEDAQPESVSEDSKKLSTIEDDSSKSKNEPVKISKPRKPRAPRVSKINKTTDSSENQIQ